MKYHISGVEIIIYEKNFMYDYMPVMQYGNQKITTIELKNALDNIVESLENLLKIVSVFDENFDRYNTAITVLKATKLLFLRKNNPTCRPTKEEFKIAMDVVAEIGLSYEKNPDIRQSIKVVNLFAQAMIGN